MGGRQGKEKGGKKKGDGATLRYAPTRSVVSALSMRLRVPAYLSTCIVVSSDAYRCTACA
eukprot:1106556-Rhodomonas_salina.1